MAQESPDTAMKSSMVMNNHMNGMTLEDDVESMLSDQFNTSNESMFKVRLHSSNFGGQLGGGLAAGDSTFRCNESAQDEERGLISESEDGWYADKDPKAVEKKEDDFEDISEHSSDERTDSSGMLEDPQGVVVVKKKKKKNADGGEKKKKKKKKPAADDQDIKKTEDDKKLIHQYKKLQEDTKVKKEPV